MNQPDDPYATPEWKAYSKHVLEEMVPMITESAVAISQVTGRGNITPEGAMQLGYLILMDKPIIAVQSPDTALSQKMQLVADEIVVGNPTDHDFPRKLREAITRLEGRL